MDENESTSKRENSLKEGEREIANMDESDFFFPADGKPYYPGFIEKCNTLSGFGTVPGFDGVLPFFASQTPRVARVRPCRGLTGLRRSRGRSSVAATTGAAVVDSAQMPLRAPGNNMSFRDVILTVDVRSFM